MVARKWTLEQRQAQAEKIRQWQPWKQSTGAKTLAGKSIASRNAFKGGIRHKLTQLRKLLQKQKKFIEAP